MLKKVKIYSSESFNPLADQIVERTLFQRGRIDWGGFDDGTPNVFIHDAEELADKHVVLILSLSQPKSYFAQLSAYYALARRSYKSLRLILPYFPTGTMERSDVVGTVATGWTLAEMLSNVRPGIKITMLDVHALTIEYYFNGRNVSVEFKSFIKDQIPCLPINSAIGFPDEGSFKRFRAMVSNPETGKIRFPYAICSKQRVGKDGEKRIVRIVDGEQYIKGKHVVLIDDLIHTGETLIECAKEFRDNGAIEVSALATHPVMEKDAHLKLAQAGFKEIIVSDSVPRTAAKISKMEPFRVHSILDLMIEAISDGIK